MVTRHTDDQSDGQSAARTPLYRRRAFWGGMAVLFAFGMIANGLQEKPSAEQASPSGRVTLTPPPSGTPSDRQSEKVAEVSQSAKASAKAKAEEELSVSVVPSVVGMTNAEAIRALHRAGFMANEEDASGRGRWSLDNDNWTVCSQDPGPGKSDAVRVAIYSVKGDEFC
ncbi:hypothetical protein ACH4S8_37890 [Streptomyces sp. NPDC021080]|uniref:hypothetical protein n=1 Tax=Streptomyces sp. NPDC021080 TaxID=3365110 RepID=UPI0037AB500E